MKKRILAIFLSVLMLFSLANNVFVFAEEQQSSEAVSSSESAEKTDIYLIIGQSNAAGLSSHAGNASYYASIAHPRVKKLDTRTGKATNQWIPGTEPTNMDNANSGGSISCGKAFAEAMLEYTPADTNIGIVNSGWGGTIIEQWAKDASIDFSYGPNSNYPDMNLYEIAIEKTRKALALGNGELKGVLWFQGENNLYQGTDEAVFQSKKDDYKAKLEALIANLRADLGNPNLPFIAAEVGTDQSGMAYSNVNTVNAALAEVAAVDENMRVISSKGLEMGGDTVHLTGAAQVKAGKRFAKAYVDLVKPEFVEEELVNNAAVEFPGGKIINSPVFEYSTDSFVPEHAIDDNFDIFTSRIALRGENSRNAITDDNRAYFGYTFPNRKIALKGVKLYCGEGGNYTYTPKCVEVFGTNDDPESETAVWTSVTKQENIVWPLTNVDKNDTKSYESATVLFKDNNTKYSSYKVEMWNLGKNSDDEVNGTGNLLVLKELQLMYDGNASSVELVDEPKKDAYLIIGQSNASGRGTVTAEDKAYDVRISKLNPDNKWMRGSEPSNMIDPGATQSAGMSLAQGLIKYTKPDHEIGIINSAWGGTSIDAWSKESTFYPYTLMPDKNLYEIMMIKVKAAIAQGAEIKGVFWHQGESNFSSGNPGNYVEYKNKLQELIKNIRTDLGNQNIPFIMGEVGSDQGSIYGTDNNVNRALHSIAEDDSKTAVTSCLGLTMQGDNVHYDSDSIRTMGQRFATAYVDMNGLTEQETPTPTEAPATPEPTLEPILKNAIEDFGGSAVANSPIKYSEIGSLFDKDYNTRAFLYGETSDNGILCSLNTANVTYQFANDAKVAICGVALYHTNENYVRAPKDIIVYGSNNNSSWTKLTEQENLTWQQSNTLNNSSSVPRLFINFDNKYKYAYYKVCMKNVGYVFDQNEDGSGQVVDISEMQLLYDESVEGEEAPEPTLEPTTTPTATPTVTTTPTLTPSASATVPEMSPDTGVTLPEGLANAVRTFAGGIIATSSYGGDSVPGGNWYVGQAFDDKFGWGTDICFTMYPSGNTAVSETNKAWIYYTFPGKAVKVLGARVFAGESSWYANNYEVWATNDHPEDETAEWTKLGEYSEADFISENIDMVFQNPARYTTYKFAICSAQGSGGRGAAFEELQFLYDANDESAVAAAPYILNAVDTYPNGTVYSSNSTEPSSVGTDWAPAQLFDGNLNWGQTTAGLIQSANNQTLTEDNMAWVSYTFPNKKVRVNEVKVWASDGTWTTQNYKIYGTNDDPKDVTKWVHIADYDAGSLDRVNSVISMTNNTKCYSTYVIAIYNAKQGTRAAFCEFDLRYDAMDATAVEDVTTTPETTEAPVEPTPTTTATAEPTTTTTATANPTTEPTAKPTSETTPASALKNAATEFSGGTVYASDVEGPVTEKYFFSPIQLFDGNTVWGSDSGGLIKSANGAKLTKGNTAWASYTFPNQKVKVTQVNILASHGDWSVKNYEIWATNDDPTSDSSSWTLLKEHSEESFSVFESNISIVNDKCYSTYKIAVYNELEDKAGNAAFREFELMYDENDPSAVVHEYITVTYKDVNNVVVNTNRKVLKGQAIAKLPVMYRDGYTFEGWLLDGELIADGVSFDEDVILKARFKKDTTSNQEYKLILGDNIEFSKVNGYTYVEGMENELTLADKVVFKMKESEETEGKQVDYWTIQGPAQDEPQVISNEQTLSFMVQPGEMKVEAVLKDIGAANTKTVAPDVIITSTVSRPDHNNRFYVYSMRVIDDPSRVVECGVIILRDTTAEETPDITLETSGIHTIKSSRQGSMGEYAIVRKDNVTDYCVRSYMKYDNGQIAYSDAVTVYLDVQ